MGRVVLGAVALVVIGAALGGGDWTLEARAGMLSGGVGVLLYLARDRRR